jgi:hypothetical protein
MSTLLWKNGFVLRELAVLFLVASVLVMNAAAQEARTTVAQSKTTYKLTVKDGPSISLSAKDAKLADVAADLAKQLNAKVKVSPILQAQTLKVEFKDLNLEPALQLLAPQVFVDYELGTDHQQVVAIFFYGYNEAPPALSAAVTAPSQALLIEGNTEDGVEPATEEARKREEEKPLKVKFLNNKLTVRARQQPVLLVIMRIGDELGIPVEIKEESRDLISTEIVSEPVEEALQRISPNLRFYVRSDLQRLERKPFLLVLNSPNMPSTTNTNLVHQQWISVRTRTEFPCTTIWQCII